MAGLDPAIPIGGVLRSSHLDHRIKLGDDTGKDPPSSEMAHPHPGRLAPADPLPCGGEWGARMTPPARIGVWTALATFALDQATKLYFLFGYDLPMREPFVLTPFLDLIVVWNPGISYGLFKQHTELGRWLL